MSRRNDLRALRRLATSHGVRPFFRDVEGVRRDPTPEALVAVLRALGEPVERPGDAPAALARRRRHLARRRVEPVCVAWQDGAGTEGVAVAGAPATAPPPSLRVTAAGGLECRLELEGGGVRTWRVSADDLPVVGSCEPGGSDDRPVPVRRLPLPGELPIGYHRLTVSGSDGGKLGESLVISAPRRFYDGGLEGERTVAADWGVFLPVYACRREGDGGPVGPVDADPGTDMLSGDLGVGDLTGLEQLGRWVAGLGGTTVATLPMLAASLYEDPESYSPYAPVSRLFWNELFVDPTGLPELAASPAARRLLASDAVAREVAELSAADLIDYRRAAALKRRVLEPLAEAFFAGDASDARRGELAALRRRRPELEEYAAFRATAERHGVDWRHWPARLRDGDLRQGDYDGDVFRFHLYAQLAAEEQVSQAAEALAASGGLYLDLPLGVAPTSYDVWREGELFVTGASAGAPPDPIFSAGQDWGFHPVDPERQRETGYRHLRAVLRHHLDHAGTLRVDHVMQLHRLFWIPRGVDKSDGLYVRYPAEEHYAILSLESHRSRTRVVGENLGTVPPYVDRALSEHGLLKMYVLPFESLPAAAEPAADAALPLARPVAGDEVASLNTHDIPTFRAWWRAEDVADRHDLGLLSDEEAEAARGERMAERESWVRRLAASGHLRPESVDSWRGDLGSEAASGAVMAAALEWMGESDSPLVLATLEDLWGEAAPQNVPGTWKERPNWRRRTALSLEQVAADGELTATLRRLDAARRKEPASPAASAHRTQAEGLRGADETHEEMRPVPRRSLLTDDDLHLFNEGRHFHLGERLGAQPRRLDGEDGYNFAVWAPNAETVSVVGDFNGWDPAAHPLEARGSSGIWEGFLPGARAGSHYKYFLRSRLDGHQVAKADPYALRSEAPPDTASVLWHLDHEWGDRVWMERRGGTAAPDAPVSIYEVHLGSWRRADADGHRFLSYREMAGPLADHCLAHGFTHVELLPITEHPFYGSWGYQCTGYYAPTARYGSPQDLMAMIDHLHQRGLGVILDWVPSHFPVDTHGLGFFDGTHLYEHADPRLGFHPDWNSYIFNYQRPEVRSFLISSALHWLRKYHVDGLRVDAVASMLRRDYSREPGQWIPNQHGGPENLEAVEMLRQLNQAVAEHAPGAVTFAEESAAWPGVTAPVDDGGLGFDYKWDMGWMNDTLDYFKRDPVHRKHHQDDLTFRAMYAWSERYLLPLSHDEVVHGKRSLLGKMPGDEWQAFANLRLLLGYQWALPGKKLLFMGGEIAQLREWDHDWSLEWHRLERPLNRGVSRWVGDLNRVYRRHPALHELDASPDGFRWSHITDHERSVLVFLRLGAAGEEGELLLAAFNLTPVPRHEYRLGVPREGHWEELLNSDAEIYGGSGQGNVGGVDAGGGPLHGQPRSLSVTLPPLGMLLLRSAAPGEGEAARGEDAG